MILDFYYIYCCSISVIYSNLGLVNQPFSLYSLLHLLAQHIKFFTEEVLLHGDFCVEEGVGLGKVRDLIGVCGFGFGVPTIFIG